MLFSQQEGIENPLKKDWFDPILHSDTQLFIDPMLLFKTDIPEFQNSKEKIQQFFQYTFEEVAKVKGRGKEALEALNNLLSFREPGEISLGYGLAGSNGKGLGKDFSRKIRDTIVDCIEFGLEDVITYVSAFSFIVEGIGPDGISDMIANILKEDFINYTQRICKEEGITCKTFQLINVGYDFENRMWRRKRVSLPENSLKPGRAVILVPKEFLRTNEVLDLDEFEFYLASIENEELRNQATKLFSKGLNVSKIKEALKKDSDVAKRAIKSYIETMEKLDLRSYNIDYDNKGIYRIHLFEESLKKSLPKKETVSNTKEGLLEFVNEIIGQYKYIIENRENYWLLYDEDGNSKPEHASQRLFWAIADTMCKKNKSIVVTRENLTGRGPVDFKFNEGYNKKIVLEIKLVKSDRIFKGLENQLTTYVSSEEADYGVYLVIKLRDEDIARFHRLTTRYEKLSNEQKSKIIIQDIDARIDNKPSASKI